MKKYIVLLCAVCLLGTAVVLSAGQPETPKGAAEISLSGGQRGDIVFPHRSHQERVTDCTICHDLFPQTPGAIQTLKNQKKLKSKKVMNTLCVKCHRETQHAGKKSGPVKCNGCHMKK